MCKYCCSKIKKGTFRICPAKVESQVFFFAFPTWTVQNTAFWRDAPEPNINQSKLK